MKNKPLTDIEWTMTWMSLRYAMNRQTIASSTLPQDLVKAYYHRWTENQKKTIVTECERNEEEILRWSGGKSKAFGDETIDRPGWLKFWAACNIKKHYKIKLIDDKIYTVFEANNRIYPLKSYIKEPHSEIFCEEKSMINKNDNTNLCKRSKRRKIKEV